MSMERDTKRSAHFPTPKVRDSPNQGASTPRNQIGDLNNTFNNAMNNTLNTEQNKVKTPGSRL
jgi:hypothetical protein